MLINKNEIDIVKTRTFPTNQFQFCVVCLKKEDFKSNDS